MGGTGGRVLFACAEPRRRDRVVSAFAGNDGGGAEVDPVAGAEAALSRLSAVDCLVVGDELADGAPLDLVTDARERVADLPIIIYAREVAPSLANVTGETDRTGFLYDDGVGIPPDRHRHR